MRQLAGFLPAGAVAPGDAARQDVAERLGQWLNVADAISLSSAHAAIAAAGRQAARTPGHLATSAETLQAELERVRAVLSQSITTRDTRHQPDPDDLDTEFALFHQRLGDQQRRMEMSIDALREHVRQQLAQSTPPMAQLAAIDAVMDGFFGGVQEVASNPTSIAARQALISSAEALVTRFQTIDGRR